MNDAANPALLIEFLQTRDQDDDPLTAPAADSLSGRFTIFSLFLRREYVGD